MAPRGIIYFWTCHCLFLDVTVCISGRDIYFFSWLCVFLHVTSISSRDFAYFYTWHLFLLVTFCISARVIYFWTWRCVFLDVTFISSRDFLYFCTCHLFLDVTLCISARASGSEIASRWYVISCFYDAIWSWYFWTRLPYFWTRLPYFWARRAPCWCCCGDWCCKVTSILTSKASFQILGLRKCFLQPMALSLHLWWAAPWPSGTSQHCPECAAKSKTVKSIKVH